MSCAWSTATRSWWTSAGGGPRPVHRHRHARERAAEHAGRAVRPGGGGRERDARSRPRRAAGARRLGARRLRPAAALRLGGVDGRRGAAVRQLRTGRARVRERRHVPARRPTRGTARAAEREARLWGRGLWSDAGTLAVRDFPSASDDLRSVHSRAMTAGAAAERGARTAVTAPSRARPSPTPSRRRRSALDRTSRAGPAPPLHARRPGEGPPAAVARGRPHRSGSRS